MNISRLFLIGILVSTPGTATSETVGEKLIVNSVGDNGIHTMVYKQIINDIEVFDTLSKRHIMPDGSLIDNRRFVDILGNFQEHSLDIDDDRVLRTIGIETTTNLMTFPVYFKSQDGLLPAIQVEVHNDGHMYTYVLEDQTYNVLFERCNTFYCSCHPPIQEDGGDEKSMFLAYQDNSPFPGNPLIGTPNGWQQTTEIHRDLIQEPYNEASPIGWNYSRILKGNNIWCTINEPQYDSEYTVFNQEQDFLYHLTFDDYSDNYQEAVATNAFVVTNQLHDYFWEHGWTEEWGNQQQTNFERGGNQSDPTHLHIMFTGRSQYALKNNAYWSGSHIDGNISYIYMFEFSNEFIDPQDRHSALSTDILAHEFVHGLFMRLTGSYNSSMHEGWADFLAMLYTTKPENDPSGVNPMASWTTYMLLGFECHIDNYYFGIRRYPYSTNMFINPLTFGDSYQPTYDVPEWIPSSCMNFGAFNGHSVGEIWAVTMWDVWGLMKERYGYNNARRSLSKLCLDSMKLFPSNGHFIEGRDALLLADEAATGGENRVLIWDAFSRRGCGIYSSAVIEGEYSVVEDFSPPDWGDYNQDNKKDIVDWQLFITDWDAKEAMADLNLDHIVNALDFYEFQSLFYR